MCIFTIVLVIAVLIYYKKCKKNYFKRDNKSENR
uniref:Virus attachment protein p12 family protein n=1 Tax=Syphacia muris TaxID=451379 RepID=A0A0N5AQ26_9BILA